MITQENEFEDVEENYIFELLYNMIYKDNLSDEEFEEFEWYFFESKFICYGEFCYLRDCVNDSYCDNRIRGLFLKTKKKMENSDKELNDFFDECDNEVDEKLYIVENFKKKYMKEYLEEIELKKIGKE